MLYLTGADLIAAAAIRAGCDFFAGYPITPASGILRNMLLQLPKFGGIGIQAEDEISSISMCIAASMAGKRVMTATSGPGMSLYSENIGLAQMGEVPLVIVDVQRMGPATGGATTNTEGDVQFARWVTSGGYPLVVYVPHDLPSTYHLMFKAFSTAEVLRTPVILLTSKNLVMTAESVAEEDLIGHPVASRWLGGKEWAPYAAENPGDVPPFLLFGEDLTRFTTSIHDERGIITEKPSAASKKLEHLAKKIDSRKNELCEMVYVPGSSETAIVAYGSCARSALEAQKKLKDVTLMILQTLSPLAEGTIRRKLDGVNRIVVPELNPGLLAPEVERICKGATVKSLTRLDGCTISPQAIIDAVAAK